MAKGKSTYTTWRCGKCQKPHATTAYNKKNNEKITKELSKFCSQCRAHTDHKRKDTKKGTK
ncbi:MAG: 50S ribosomal protein L33 [Candidatus Altimarinota bacterium]